VRARWARELYHIAVVSNASPLTKNNLNQPRFCRYDALSIARGRGARDIIILLGCPLIARPIAALAPQLLTRADDVIE
jgi:hypothetical protein